ncbi:MAG: ferrochelatase [Pseudomonas sp.]
MTDHALLLVNLGSPASTAVADVRRYLDQFLMDPYVVDLPWPLRRLLVSLILRKRPAASAHAYASIWWEQGSPLVVLSRRLQAAMQAHWSQGPVELAMRYGEPSIEAALTRLAAQGIQRVTLAPLYPQFAESTVTTAVEEARRVLRERGLGLRLEVLPPFYDQPEYLEALVASAKPYLEQDFDHLLLSFHGLPERHIRKLVGDPHHDLQAKDSRGVGAEVLALCYRSQCLRTAEAFAERAGLRPEQWSVSFQSRLGRAKWIEPYTETRLEELAQQGVRKLLVMCPAFVADCIETLEEIGIRGREQFQAAGGAELVLVPCLNDHPAWSAALARLCRRVPLLASGPSAGAGAVHSPG